MLGNTLRRTEEKHIYTVHAAISSFFGGEWAGLFLGSKEEEKIFCNQFQTPDLLLKVCHTDIQCVPYIKKTLNT